MLVDRAKDGRMFYYHFQSFDGQCCYIKKCEVYLIQHPYQRKEKRAVGRPKIEVTDVAARNRLLRMRGALEHRKRQLLNDGGYLENRVKIHNLNAKVKEICEQLEMLGGIPKSWR